MAGSSTYCNIAWQRQNCKAARKSFRTYLLAGDIVFEPNIVSSGSLAVRAQTKRNGQKSSGFFSLCTEVGNREEGVSFVDALHYLLYLYVCMCILSFCLLMFLDAFSMLFGSF